jgi:uncharacterized membrane protein
MLRRTAAYISISLLILSVLNFYIHYQQLPETVPLHFNAKGSADRFGNKEILWFFFGVMAFVMFILELVKKADPSVLNYPKKYEVGNFTKVHSISLELLSIIQLWIGGLTLLMSRHFILTAQNRQMNAMCSFWLYIIVLMLVVLVYVIRLRKI